MISDWWNDLTIYLTFNEGDWNSAAVEYLAERAFLYGIFQSGFGCLTDYTAVFVQVPYLISWIKTTLDLWKTTGNQLDIVNKIVIWLTILIMTI